MEPEGWTILKKTTGAYFKISPTFLTFIRGLEEIKRNLQSGGKASNTDCIAVGTNSVQDFRYSQFS